MSQDLLDQKIDAYYAARADYDTKKEASNAADKIRRSAETELVDYMIENQVQGHKRTDGTAVTLKRTVSIRMNKGIFEPVRLWLCDTVGDDADYIETVVSKSAVLEHVKKLIIEDDVDPADLPDCLGVDARPTLAVTGWNQRA